MRGRRTACAAVALIALVAGIAVGLLAMHVLPGLGSTGQSDPTMSMSAAVPSAHHEKSVAAPTMSSDSKIQVADPTTSDHLHDSLSCILFLVGSITLVIAAAWLIRARRTFGAPRAVVHRFTELVQRPPPTSVRLSLVGTSRC